VVANASAAVGLAGRLLHGVPPAMFVICFESVTLTARRGALAALGMPSRTVPRWHPVRWLLAPRDTWRCWRQAVLDGVTPPPPTVPTAQQTKPRTPSPIPGPGSRHALVERFLQENPDAAAPELRSHLVEHGHAISLRTVQRLRSAALPPAGYHQG
jgi:hypothetical protein